MRVEETDSGRESRENSIIYILKIMSVFMKTDVNIKTLISVFSVINVFIFLNYPTILLFLHFLNHPVF